MATTNHGNDPVTGVTGSGPNSCNLYYQDPTLSANATEAIDLTLIGQQDVQPLTPDEVIVVKVSPYALGDSLVYASQWTGPITTTAGVQGSDAVNGSAQSYPQVVFRPKVLVDNALVASQSTALGRFLALDTDAKAEYKFTDDSGDNSLWTLQSYFANTPFVFTNPLLAQIPAESVKSVTVSKLSTAPLTVGNNAKLGATNFTASEAASNIMPDYVSSTTGFGATPAANDYALDLFQQADAAGKVAYWQVATGAAGTSGSTTAVPASAGEGLGNAVGAFSQVKFVAGDSITVYVTYNMIKTKEFHLDAPSALGGPGTAKYTLTAADGSVINVEDGVQMESSPASVVIAYQFMAE